jgi:hypothetical protein
MARNTAFDSTTMERDLLFRVPSEQLDATTLIQQIAGLSIAGITVQAKNLKSHDSTISAFDAV